MTDPRQIPIREYTYSLPEERIAKFPLPERDASKLLLYRNGLIRERIYRDLATEIPEGALMVFNDTRVVEARLSFRKPTGGNIEIFCLEPHPDYPDISTALAQKGKVLWHCLIGGASKWKAGQVLVKSIRVEGMELLLEARYREKSSDVFVIELNWSPSSLSFAEVLHHLGAIPLPPYIKRDAETSDRERYQTVYARAEGSVAAPTAGLHFTEHIFQELEKKHIRRGQVTLHVGAGTFKPVKSETIGDHEMHAEWIDVSRPFLEQLQRQQGRPVIAVGTTSLRTLESLYWLGVKALKGHPDPVAAGLEQWECYEQGGEPVPVERAIGALLQWMAERKASRIITRTRIIIAPGYELKMADALVTNFHQPQSTLLLLIAAVIGDDWKSVYTYALKNDFRFLSYGDGSLLWKKPGGR